MRKYTTYGVVFLGVLLMTASTFWAIRLHSQNTQYSEKLQELNEQLEQMQSDVSHSGGAETIPTEPRGNLNGEFAFPIAEEDFRFYSSPYGLRVSPILNVERKHEGLDIGGVWKAQVVSIADGTVVEHWPIGVYGGKRYRGHNVYGWMVRIEHDNRFESLYAHLSSTRMPFIQEGARIEKGEPIGRVGNTGLADGNHLHFELIRNGETVNPLLYLPEPK